MIFKVGDRVKVTAEAAAGMIRGMPEVDRPSMTEWLSQEHVVTQVKDTSRLSMNWPYLLDDRFYFGFSELELVNTEPTLAQKEIDAALVDECSDTGLFVGFSNMRGYVSSWIAVTDDQLAAIRNILGE